MKQEITLELSMHIGTDNTSSLRISDRASGCIVFDMKIKDEQMMQLLSNRYAVKVDADYYPSDNIGKKMHVDKFTFPMPEEAKYKDRQKVAYEQAKILCPKGWTPDSQFNSQDSFFHRNQRLWARAVMRKWE